MSGLEIFDEIEHQRRQGVPFCVATVVRTADVTSAKAGAKAVVTEGGGIVGHLGGGCLQRAVREAAEKALDDGKARHIRVKPTDAVDAPYDDDGAALFGSGCPSGGTVDLLVEAYRPDPKLVVVGETPIALALAAIGAHLRYRMRDIGAGDTPFDALDRRDTVIVASQGQGDLAMLSGALRSGAGRVLLVASRRKADALRTRLREDGFDDTALNRIEAPAGLDIGAIDPSEIAISIFADLIVNERSRGG